MEWQDIRSLLQSFIFWILTLIIPSIVVIWGKVKKYFKGPYILIAFMGTLALGLFIYNNIPVEWPIRSSQIQTNIQSWAEEAGYRIGKMPVEGERFHLVITDNTMTIEVLNKKNLSPHVIFIAPVQQ